MKLALNERIKEIMRGKSRMQLAEKIYVNERTSQREKAFAEAVIICRLDNAQHELKREMERKHPDYLDGIFDMHDKAYEIVKEVFKND